MNFLKLVAQINETIDKKNRDKAFDMAQTLADLINQCTFIGSNPMGKKKIEEISFRLINTAQYVTCSNGNSLTKRVLGENRNYSMLIILEPFNITVTTKHSRQIGFEKSSRIQTTLLQFDASNLTETTCTTDILDESTNTLISHTKVESMANSDGIEVSRTVTRHTNLGPDLYKYFHSLEIISNKMLEFISSYLINVRPSEQIIAHRLDAETCSVATNGSIKTVSVPLGHYGIADLQGVVINPDNNEPISLEEKIKRTPIEFQKGLLLLAAENKEKKSGKKH